MTLPIYALIRTEADVPEDNAWMAPAEAEALEKLRFPKRRAEWRLGRYTAKQAIVTCFAEAHNLPSIAICAAPDGAPDVYIHGDPAPYSLSISHREGSAFCVVAPGTVAVGCDLEKVEPRSAAFVADYFTKEEQALVENASEADRAWLANLIWSAKESALKVLREGLRLDTRSVVVHLPVVKKTPAWSPMSVYFSELGQTFEGWYRVDAGYVQTVSAWSPPARPVMVP